MDEDQATKEERKAYEANRAAGLPQTYDLYDEEEDDEDPHFRH